MPKFKLLRRVLFLFIVWLCAIIRPVNTIGYFQCTNNVELAKVKECTQGCLATEMQIRSTTKSHGGESQSITTYEVNDILPSMTTTTKFEKRDTTVLEKSGTYESERAFTIPEISISLDTLSTSGTKLNDITNTHNAGTLSSATGSQFSDQKTTPVQTTITTRSAHTTGHLTSSSDVNSVDLKTATEKMATTGYFDQTTEINRSTTHDRTINKVVTTESESQHKDTLTSEKFHIEESTMKKKSSVTAKAKSTIEYTSYSFTTKDYPKTAAETSTGELTNSKRTVGTNITHTTETAFITTNNPTEINTSALTEIYTSQQEPSTDEVQTTEIIPTTKRETETKKHWPSNTQSTLWTSDITTAQTLTPPSCPPNMVYMNCSCQTTCANPNRVDGCYNNCNGVETCICPDGFYLKGENCVRPEECGCYSAVKGAIIEEEDTQLFTACTSQCSCISGVLSCNAFQCHSEAICANTSGTLACSCKDGYYGDGSSCTRLTDCRDVYDSGLVDDGVYMILPMNWPGAAFSVYCKESSTVFQRRQDGSVDFYRSWSDYKEGFGYLNHEMWLGLEKLYYLTNQGYYQLQILLVREGISYELHHTFFRIDNEGNNYRLTELGSYSGDLGYDIMRRHHTYQFSTPDRDNDNHPDINCAEESHGAWWYKSCTAANLNGRYGYSGIPGICYYIDMVRYCNVSFTEISIKPV